MPESQSIHEVEPKKPLADAVREVFERRATKGEQKLIIKTYQKKLEALVQKMPAEQQKDIAIKIQKGITVIRGAFAEYGARFIDFMRKIFLWPMIRVDKDFPKDKYYQIELARAKAWGEFGMDTTKTATAERTAYRDHFLSTSLSHAQAVGASVGVSSALWGALEGAKIGTVVGLGAQGAAAGAVVGGIAGGAYSLSLFMKDKIMGPPTAFYDLFWGSGRRNPVFTSISPPAVSPGTIVSA